MIVTFYFIVFMVAGRCSADEGNECLSMSQTSNKLSTGGMDEHANTHVIKA